MTQKPLACGGLEVSLHVDRDCRYSRRRMLTAMALGALLEFAPAAAHHSIAGEYDLSRQVILRGVITQVDWINPHAHVYLDVEEPDGSTVTWALATVPPLAMHRAGLTPQALSGAPGETVAVEVLPAPAGEPRGWILKITYRDGHYYQLWAR